MRLGSSLDKVCDMGAIIDPCQKKYIAEYVEEARKEGAEVRYLQRNSLCFFFFPPLFLSFFSFFSGKHFLSVSFFSFFPSSHLPFSFTRSCASCVSPSIPLQPCVIVQNLRSSTKHINMCLFSFLFPLLLNFHHPLLLVMEDNTSITSFSIVIVFSQVFQVEAPPGCFYPPTLITDVGTTSKTVVEEIFGPVLVAMPFRYFIQLLQLFYF